MSRNTLRKEYWMGKQKEDERIRNKKNKRIERKKKYMK